MEVKGKLIEIMPIENGVSSNGKNYQKRNFVIDTWDKYSPLICFRLYGDKVNIVEDNMLNREVTVRFNLSSR